jgi:hypothetical protein
MYVLHHYSLHNPSIHTDLYLGYIAHIHSPYKYSELLLLDSEAVGTHKPSDYILRIFEQILVVQYMLLHDYIQEANNVSKLESEDYMAVYDRVGLSSKEEALLLLCIDL